MHLETLVRFTVAGDIKFSLNSTPKDLQSKIASSRMKSNV